MADRSLLLSPKFWYLFVIGAVVSLFIIGLRRANDNSLLARARRDLAVLSGDLNRTEEGRLRAESLAEARKQEIEHQHTAIETLTAELNELKSAIPPQGRERGLLSLFNGCACADLHIWIDGVEAGVAVAEPDASGKCGAIGAVTASLAPGTHQVTARDRDGHSWNFEVQVVADGCTRHQLIRTQ